MPAVGQALSADFEPQLEPPRSAPSAANSSQPAAAWTCSMHPQVRELKPGKCPVCGMALKPLAAPGRDGGAP